jgi:hypothetical protein
VNAVPRQTQLAVGPLVAALGAVILIVSLFLDWYETFTGFTIFEFLDLLLLLLALAMIAALAAGLGLVRMAVPPGAALAVALLAIFVVVSQLLNDPPAVTGSGPDKDIGIWLALSGSALMVAGAVLSSAHISLALETRPRERAAGAGPAPGPPDQDPTRPLSDPAAPRRPDDPARP